MELDRHGLGSQLHHLLAAQLIGTHCLHCSSPLSPHSFFLQGRTFSFESNSLFFIVLVSLELFSKPPWTKYMKSFLKFPSQLLPTWLRTPLAQGKEIARQGYLWGFWSGERGFRRPQSPSSFMLVMLWNPGCLGWMREWSLADSGPCPSLFNPIQLPAGHLPPYFAGSGLGGVAIPQGLPTFAWCWRSVLLPRTRIRSI